jgi:amino acid transporter
VIQTGAIALVGFVFGDYATQLLPLGPYSSSIYAALCVVALTAVNIIGTLPGTRVQKTLETATVLAIVIVIIVGFSAPSEAAKPASPSMGGALGLAPGDLGGEMGETV